MTETIFTLKRKNFNILKSFLFPESDKKSIGLIDIKNQELLETLLPWLEVLPANFSILTLEDKESNSSSLKYITQINQETILWYDFVIVDNDCEKITEYMKSGITPILPNWNYLWNLLQEFDPIKTEWNSYLYEENNFWSIYYATIRYLENFKFPYDNRNLVKNVSSL